MVDGTGATVTVWGSRGDLPCAGPEFVRFGGNTACLTVEQGERLFVFGAGTGLRVLGNALLAAGRLLDIDIFLTHSHLDQIQGIPFFKPFYNPKNRFRIWAGHLGGRGGLRGAIGGMMQAPLFPIPPSFFTAQIDYRDFTPGTRLDLADGFSLSSAAMDRVDGATGYRLDLPDGHAIAVLPLATGMDDPALVTLCRDVDMLIADNPADAGLPALQTLAGAARARRLVLTCHAPDQDDGALTRLAHRAEGGTPPLHLAREGERLSL